MPKYSTVTKMLHTYFQRPLRAPSPVQALPQSCHWAVTLRICESRQHEPGQVRTTESDSRRSVRLESRLSGSRLYLPRVTHLQTTIGKELCVLPREIGREVGNLEDLVPGQVTFMRRSAICTSRFSVTLKQPPPTTHRKIIRKLSPLRA